MSLYFPQAAATLRVLWEDFGQGTVAKLQEYYVLNVIPKRALVNINDYTQADTFELEIDYKQFPFDPRAIRSCGVTIHMEDMKKPYDGTEITRIKPSEDNARFVGFADEEGITFDDSSRVVRLEGRDLTSLLIDEKYRGGPVDLGRPLDVVLRQLLDQLQSTTPLALDNRVQGTLPTIAQFAPDFGAMATKKNVKKDETYWDVIQDLAARAGLIAYIELDKLVLSKPRVLYADQAITRMIYGKNLRRLEFKRKIGRLKNFNVIVRSLKVESKQVIDAKIPEDATESWSRATGIPNRRVQIQQLKADGTKDEPKDAPFLAFRVPNIGSKAQLTEIGQNIYEDLSRQQIEGSMETYEMEAIDSVGNCANLLELRNGSPVSVDIDQGDLEGLNRQKTVEERTRFLIDRCYDPKVASVLANTLGRFNMTFYTKAVKFTIDRETGFRLDLDFINFIETPTRSLNLGTR